jgi:hypothetical protein
MEGAIAIGLVDHTDDVPSVAYFERPVAASQELLALSNPLPPTELFRFAAPCETSACSHWNGKSCKLAQRIVHLLPAITADLPKCHIRGSCRWYAQEGRHACFRCPQIVTQNEEPSETMREAALPK